MNKDIRINNDDNKNLKMNNGYYGYYENNGDNENNKYGKNDNNKYGDNDNEYCENDNKYGDDDNKYDDDQDDNKTVIHILKNKGNYLLMEPSMSCYKGDLVRLEIEINNFYN